MKIAFKSLPKKTRSYYISNLVAGKVIYSPAARRSYLITQVGTNGYMCINQQSELTCYLELQVFTGKCYTSI
jgi:hypothetical protein